MVADAMSYFTEYNRYMLFIGIAVILTIAAIFSRHRTKISVSLVASGLALQCAIAFCVLRTTIGNTFISTIASGVQYLYVYAAKGTGFIFGNLSVNQEPWGPVFAIQILPMIIFFGAFMSLLFHFGIVQKVVAGMGAVVRPLLGTSGAETLCAVANSFLGQTEAPLLIRHYLAHMTESEMLVVMVSGMATISGSILAVYASFGVPIKHLLAASVMAIPASIVIAKILMPETEKRAQEEVAVDHVAQEKGNVFEALASGTIDGLHLTLNVAAMLLSFYAITECINGCLSGISSYANFYAGTSFPLLNVKLLFAWLCAPFGYLLGFNGFEALQIGQLIGTKVSLNEFFAYRDLVAMGISDRALILGTYALCGFANFSSIGIQIGGIGALVPSKRGMLTRLSMRALLGGVLANILSALVAGLFI